MAGSPGLPCPVFHPEVATSRGTASLVGAVLGPGPPRAHGLVPGQAEWALLQQGAASASASGPAPPREGALSCLSGSALSRCPPPSRCRLSQLCSRAPSLAHTLLLCDSAPSCPSQGELGAEAEMVARGPATPLPAAFPHTQQGAPSAGVSRPPWPQTAHPLDS